MERILPRQNCFGLQMTLNLELFEVLIMCMKYVNSTVECYTSMASNSSGSVSYSNLFNRIHASVRQNGNMEVGGFIVVTRINILGTAHKEHENANILMQRGTLDVIIRLTKCSPDESKQLCIDLDSFSLDLKKEDKEKHIDHACFDYFNYTRITDIKDFDLDAGLGKYVIKVLMKKHEDSDYTIQTMSSLYIESPKE